MSASEYALLQEQIKSLTTLVNAHFQNVHERLDKINGHVGDHEDKITEALIERSKNREEQRHYIGEICECKNKLIHIENKLEDLNFILKHPKLFVTALVVIVMLTLGTFISNNPLQVFTPQPAQTEQTK